MYIVECSPCDVVGRSEKKSDAWVKTWESVARLSGRISITISRYC